MQIIKIDYNKKTIDHENLEDNTKMSLILQVILLLLGVFNLPTIYAWAYVCITHFKTNTEYFKGEISYRASNIIDNDSSSSASVVHGSQAMVPLLSSGVPNFKFHSCIIDSQCLWKEGCPYCWLLSTQYTISTQQQRLTHSISYALAETSKHGIKFLMQCSRSTRIFCE